MLDQHDQNSVGEQSQTVVMSGHPLDQKVARLVTEERLLRFFYTPIQFGVRFATCADHDSTVVALPSARPLMAEVLRSDVVPLKFDKRVGDTRQGFDALGSVDVLHSSRMETRNEIFSAHEHPNNPTVQEAK